MTKLSATGAAVVSFGVIFSATLNIASAAEIQVLCAVALKPAIDVLLPEFEKFSGNKVNVSFETVGALTGRIQKGEAADVAIVSGPQNDALQSQGKIVSGSRVDVAKVGVGAFVHKGGAKPDFSSVDAFKRTLLAAKSIAYPDPAGGGASGVYMAGLLDRLDIGADMKPKTKLLPAGKPLYDSVASGNVEIGFNQISENLAATEVEFGGALPTSIQGYTVFAAGIVATSRQPEAGKALITFLASPASSAIMKTKGFE
jgi:molybdate transport system substrate-binding protein